MDQAWGSYAGGPKPTINGDDRDALRPILKWLEQGEQRGEHLPLNPERIGGLLGIPPSTVRGWTQALPPFGEPALPWLLEYGGALATQVRQWQSRKSR
jgi:hypothetical protein